MKIPFSEAISDPNLLGRTFQDFSFPQKVVLKALYGLPLSDKIVNKATGWNELDYWAIVQGSFDHDELGYVTKIRNIDYTPKEYNQLWAVIGRRTGKTSTLQSFVIAYEATCGGHTDYIRPGQQCVIYLIAQRLDVARANLSFITSILHESPVLKEEIEAENADSIKLKNGISILPSPPSLKAQRGMAIPVVALDEVGFWYKDAESANPDFEVERAVRMAQLQFPNYKRIGISTPWTKEGLLWKYHRAGTEGIKLPLDERAGYEGTLVCFSTTASFENPLLERAGGRKRLLKERGDDEEAFSRECLCVFADSISGFLGRANIDIAVAKGKGISERGPVDFDKATIIPNYVCAIDPAFRHDDFSLTILHKESTGVVVDMVKRWSPFRGQKLNPKVVLAEIVQLIAPFGISTVHTDQYQLESLQQLAFDMGINLIGTDFTSKSKIRIFGSLQQLVNQHKLTLLDVKLNPDCQELYTQLTQLERRMTRNNTIQISAPEGKKDDMVSSLALATSQAMLLDPEIVVREEEFRTPTLFERCQATLDRNRRALEDVYN